MSVEDLSNDLLRAAEQNDVNLVKSLVKDGALPWCQDEDGWTSLHFAALNQNNDLIDFLLSNGAIWNLVDFTGMTAGDIAFSLNNRETYETIYGFGLRAEMLRPLLSQQEDLETTNTRNQEFLQKKLSFERQGDRERCLDEDSNVVMAGWERNIMLESAKFLCERDGTVETGLRVLNIGFGLGIIDSALQEYSPSLHVIVEPHPDVINHARSKGWLQKPNVHFVQSTWQEFVDKVESGEEEAEFDAIYIDTFAEDYPALHSFFDHIPNMISGPSSKFSFFHGLGATQRLFYDVYTGVAEMHLKDIGLDTTWSEVTPQDGNETDWDDALTRYWDVASSYRLPISSMNI